MKLYYFLIVVFLVSCQPNLEELDEKAEYFEKLEDYTISVKLRTQILNRLPHNIHALYNRGVGYQALGKLDLAFLDYQSVLKIDSLHLESHFNIAALYQSQRNFEKSILHFSTILNQKGIKIGFKKEGSLIDKETPFLSSMINLDEVRYQRGNSYLILKRYKEAINDFEKCKEHKYKLEKVNELIDYYSNHLDMINN